MALVIDKAALAHPSAALHRIQSRPGSIEEKLGVA
jgi:hypothetical protein